MKEKRKKICKNRLQKGSWILILSALCIFALAVAEGLKSRADVSFFPINGDFQHYNMFRRLLDGQVPFRDFFVMLGLGVMYTNSLVLTIIGNSFANSVFATHFLLVLNGAFIVFMLTYLFWQNKSASVLTALGFSIYLVCFDRISSTLLALFPRIASPLNFVENLLKCVAALFIPDNASRPLRQAVLYVAAFAIIFIYRQKKNRVAAWFFNRSDYSRSALYGAFAGLCFLWANDYGPATYVGMSLLLFLWFAKKWLAKRDSFKKLIFSCFSYIGASVLTTILAVFLLTAGNFTAWFKSSFSTAGEVFWYNGIFVTGAKLLTIPEIPPFNGAGIYPLCFAVLSLIISIVRWFKKKETGVVLLAHIMVTFSMLFVFYFLIIKRGYESEYLNAFRQYALFGTAWLIGKVLSLLFRPLVVKIKNKKTLNKVIVFVLTILMLIGGFRYAFDIYMWYPYAAAPNYAYVEELGGNVTSFHGDIAHASDMVRGKTLFSTFSTAVEVVNGIYQPSRYDYITFTFGDHSREEYINAFHESDPDYVSIINRDFTRWEGPLCGVKWFFYRQLLDNYSYEFSNSYARYLKKTDVSSVADCDFTLTVTQLDNGTVELVATSDQNVTDLVADVKISYSSRFTEGRLKQTAVNKMVTVTGNAGYFFPKEHFECWFIPEAHDEWYLPILIEEGVGRVVLSTIPVECTALDVTGAQVLALYDFEKVFGENN